MREVDPPSDHRRPRAANVWAGVVRRVPDPGGQSTGRHGLPIVRALPLAYGRPERRAGPRGARHPAGGPSRPRAEVHRRRRPHGIRERVPPRAEWRQEAARGPRARPRDGAVAALHGRTVPVPGSAHRPEPAGRDPPAVGESGSPAEGRPHGHALDRGSRVSRGSRDRPVEPTRTDGRGTRDRFAAAPEPQGAGVLRLGRRNLLGDRVRRVGEVSNIGEGVGRETPVTDFRSMSKVSVGQILGLVEAVDEVGGGADAATIAREVDMGIDRVGPLLGAGEFLGLVNVDDGDIRITDLSRKLLMANVRERKKIIREIIDDLPTFRLVMDMARNTGTPLGRQEVLQALADRVGSHQAEDVFKALVYWGRYAELVRYDSESEQLTVRVAPT